MNINLKKTLIAGFCIIFLLSLPANIEVFKRAGNIYQISTITFAVFLFAVCALYIFYLIFLRADTTNKSQEEKIDYLEVLLKKKEAELSSIKSSLEKELTEYRKAEKQSEEIKKHLKELAVTLESVREEERTRISREIHDELGQQLTGLKMDIAWINKRIDKQPELSGKVSSMLGLVDNTIKTVRKISTELRPGILDDLGLIPAIEWQCNECEKRNGIRCVFHNHIGEKKFSEAVSTAVFRIVQEALTNVLRHSEATQIDISMKSENKKLVVSIKDNGKGLDEEAVSNTKTLGLVGIKERAELIGGECSIKGEKGLGTLITLSIPEAA